MNKLNRVSLGELLTKSNIPSENPDPNKRITVKLNGEGIEKRPFRKERQGATKYYIRKAGQFIYGKQNLHKGAFGIIPQELDGYESTIDLPSFDIDESKILPEWLILILKKDNFYKTLESIASGSATKRIHPQRLFQLQIHLPSINQQKSILEKYDEINNYYNEINDIIYSTNAYIIKLRQSILQEAVQGKLVPQDPNDEPANILLEKIKEEKKRLIKENKIKKEKPLPPITEDETSYELPMGWEWVKLGEVIQLISGQHISSSDHNTDSIGIGYLTGPSDFGDLYTNITKWTEYPKTIARKKDILITVKGSGVGKLNILTEDAAIGRQLMAIRPILINYWYIYYVLSYNQDLFQSKKVGIAIPGISREDVLNLNISVPPLNEQIRIVHKIEQLLALCNELEKNIKQSKNDSKLLMQTVLQEAFKEKNNPEE